MVLSYIEQIENKRLDLQTLKCQDPHTSATNVKAQHEGRMGVKIGAQPHQKAHLQCSDSAHC